MHSHSRHHQTHDYDHDQPVKMEQIKEILAVTRQSMQLPQKEYMTLSEIRATLTEDQFAFFHDIFLLGERRESLGKAGGVKLGMDRGMELGVRGSDDWCNAMINDYEQAVADSKNFHPLRTKGSFQEWKDGDFYQGTSTGSSRSPSNSMSRYNHSDHLPTPLSRFSLPSNVVVHRASTQKSVTAKCQVVELDKLVSLSQEDALTDCELKCLGCLQIMQRYVLGHTECSEKAMKDLTKKALHRIYEFGTTKDLIVRSSKAVEFMAFAQPDILLLRKNQFFTLMIEGKVNGEVNEVNYMWKYTQCALQLIGMTAQMNGRWDIDEVTEFKYRPFAILFDGFYFVVMRLGSESVEVSKPLDDLGLLVRLISWASSAVLEERPPFPRNAQAAYLVPCKRKQPELTSDGDLVTVNASDPKKRKTLNAGKHTSPAADANDGNGDGKEEEEPPLHTSSSADFGKSTQQECVLVTDHSVKRLGKSTREFLEDLIARDPEMQSMIQQLGLPPFPDNLPSTIYRVQDRVWCGRSETEEALSRWLEE